MPAKRHIGLDQLDPERVCIIKPSALGDVVQSLPILAALRRHWPSAQFTWVIHGSLRGLLVGQPDLNHVIEFNRSARGLGRLKSTWQLARELSAGKFDLAIDLQGLLRSGLMALGTRAARRVGFAHAREGAAHFYTDRVGVADLHMPAVERYWHVARALGCPGDPPPARLGLTAELRHWADQQLARLPRPIIAIHPGAQWETKRWPPEHFADLARRAQTQFGATIVLVGGPGEGGLAEAISGTLSGPCINLAEKTKLLELAALAEAVDLFLSGDTGPMHLAAAVGTPVVGVFTCTSPIESGPFGPLHRTVATCVPCAASYITKCPAMICMQELVPDRVWPTLERALIDATQRPQQRAG